MVRFMMMMVMVMVMMMPLTFGIIPTSSMEVNNAIRDFCLLLLHCYTVVTLLLHCCYTVISLL
jgi:hypothetical protein